MKSTSIFEITIHQGSEAREDCLYGSMLSFMSFELPLVSISRHY